MPNRKVKNIHTVSPEDLFLFYYALPTTDVFISVYVMAERENDFVSFKGRDALLSETVSLNSLWSFYIHVCTFFFFDKNVLHISAMWVLQVTYESSIKYIFFDIFNLKTNI